MAILEWDNPSNRYGEVGVSRGVLFVQDTSVVNKVAYKSGVPWNGLISVDEKTVEADETEFYADKVQYASLQEYKKFSLAIEAYTYPDEFEECCGFGELTKGIVVGQQERKAFALSYRTEIYNAYGEEAGYKIHIIYGATARPDEKTYETVNDVTEAGIFKWDVSTTPIKITRTEYFDKTMYPTSTLVIDSRYVDPAIMKGIEAVLYGSDHLDSTLITPDEVISLFYNPSVGI